MFACPLITMLAVRSVSSPRIGHSRAFNLVWSASHRLLSYCPVLWNAAGFRSSITFARTEARSVMTPAGARCAISDAVKNRLAEGAISLFLAGLKNPKEVLAGLIASPLYIPLAQWVR